MTDKQQIPPGTIEFIEDKENKKLFLKYGNPTEEVVFELVAERVWDVKPEEEEGG